MLIELNAGQTKIIEKFLNRVEIKGKEVPDFLNLINALNRPVDNMYVLKNNNEGAKNDADTK